MKRLAFILKLQDRVTAVARKAQRAVQGISERVALAQKKLRAFGQSAMLVGRGLTTGITLPAVALGGWFVKLASDAAEMRNRFGLVFGSMTTQVGEDLRLMGERVKRSDTTLMGFASSFQTVFNAMGFAQDEGARMSTVLTELTVDLSSFFNISEGDAMDRLQSGLVGNHEALRSFGIVITQATLEQELLTLGIEGGIQAASEQEKMMARLALIMRGTSDAQGDATRTSGEFANKLRGTIDRARKLGETIGTKLLPYADKLLTWAENGITWFEGLTDSKQNLVIAAVAVGAALGPVIFILGALATAVAAILSPIGLVILGIIGLGAVLVWAYNRFEWFRNAIDRVWAFIRTDVANLWGFVTDKTEEFIGWFTTLPSRFFEMGANLLQGLADGVTSALGTVRDSITGAGDQVVGWFRDRLGIRSPSKVFETLGRALPAGLERGIESGRRQVAGAVGTLGAAAMLTTSGAGVGGATASIPAPASVSSGGSTYNITIPISSAGGDSREIARDVRRELTLLLEELASEDGS